MSKKSIDLVTTKTSDSDRADETVKVKDLIEALGKCDPEAFVITEGCDCFGMVCSIQADDGEVYLMRRKYV